MVVEFLIAAASEPEPWRKKEGDVICARPAGRPWGKKERTAGLIVRARGISLEDALSLAGPCYEGGVVSAKRRHAIPLEEIRAGWLPGMDLSRVRDRSDDYQPLLSAGVVVDFSEPVAVCFDKRRGRFKYEARRRP